MVCNNENLKMERVIKKKYFIKKGEQKFTFFCPKSTMNLTYLCYGATNLYVFLTVRLFFRQKAYLSDKVLFVKN